MKPSIAIYLQHYLSPSMTFIYRQLKGVEKEFNPIVLTSFIKENLGLFPHSSFYYKPNPLLKFFTKKYLRILHNPYFKNSFTPELNSIQRKFFTQKIVDNQVKLIHAHFGPSGIEVLPVAKSLKFH